MTGVGIAGYVIYQHYSVGIRASVEARDVAERLRIEVMELRAHEALFFQDDLLSESFYKGSDSPHLQQWLHHQAKAEELSLTLFKNKSDPKFEEVLMLHDMIEAHQATITHLAEQYRLRGFREYGIDGEWRGQVAKAEILIGNGPNLAAFKKLQEAKELALRYLNENNLSLAERAQKIFDDLKTYKPKLKSVDQLKFQWAISAAAMSFSEYVQIERTLGLDDSSGVRKQIIGDLRKMDQLVIAKVERLRVDVMRDRQRLENAIEVIFFFGVVAQIALLALITRSVVRPLEKLKLWIHRTSEGERNVDLKIEGTLEMRELGQSFSSMVKNLDSSQEQLMQSQKLTALGTLAGGIAHDFNNILTSIDYYVGQLQERAGDRMDLAKGIKVIDKSTKRATQLTKQILTFSRKGTIEFERLQLSDLLEEVELMVTRTFPKHIVLEFDVAGEIPAVMGNSSQMIQILMNLAVNARDAMPTDGVIRMSASVARPPAGAHFINASECVRLAVQDTGSGIPSDALAKIFEPFYTTKEAGKGTGLGLYMVQEIVQKHHGYLRVNSEVGKGTLFEIFLPIATAEVIPLKTEVKSAA